MSLIDVLGFLAGFLTSFSASPQLYYSYKTRDVRSFDLKFLFMLASGLLLWGLYGLVIGSVPIIIFNFVGVALWLPIIAMKVKQILSGSGTG
jgi:MtN3 and saliva related transmembrane protein